MIKHIDLGNTKAPPIVFIHGFPFNRSMWQQQLKISAKTYRTIAYDIRGLGESEDGVGHYSIESHVDDLIALLDQLHIKKTTIVGFSMGGYIALRALERNPERFNAIVLSNTKSEADTDQAKLKRFITIKQVLNNGCEYFADSFVKLVFTKDSLKTKPEIVDGIRNMIKATSPGGIAGNLLALAARTDTTSSLRKIKIPTLIITGENDIITTPTDAAYLHEKIEGSQIHVIANTAHMSNLENPKVYNDILFTFLENLSKNYPGVSVTCSFESGSNVTPVPKAPNSLKKINFLVSIL